MVVAVERGKGNVGLGGKGGCSLRAQKGQTETVRQIVFLCSCYDLMPVDPGSLKQRKWLCWIIVLDTAR